LLSKKSEDDVRVDFEEFVSSLKISSDNNRDESIENHLWSLLDSKLNNLFYDDLINFYNMEQEIYTMDYFNWNIAIGFELLDASYYKDENIYQTLLLDYLKELKSSENN